MPDFGAWARSGALSDVRILDLIGTVVERCEGPGEPGPGHLPVEAARVVAALRRLLREGTPWRGPRATPTQASGPAFSAATRGLGGGRTTVAGARRDTLVLPGVSTAATAAFLAGLARGPVRDPRRARPGRGRPAGRRGAGRAGEADPVHPRPAARSRTPSSGSGSTRATGGSATACPPAATGP